MEREPCSFVQLTLGGKTQKSKTCNFTKDPVWGQAFTFLVHNVPSESLHLEIKDKDRETALGTLVFSLANLLRHPEMTHEQKFQLDHSGSDSFIKIKLVLRALSIEQPDPENRYVGVNALKQVPIPATEEEGNEGKTRPPPPAPPPPSPLPSKTEVLKVPQGSKDLSVHEPVPAISPSLNVTENQPVVIEAAAAVNEPHPWGLDPSYLVPPPPISAVPTLPGLQRLQVAPSMASLGSLASSDFDVTCSNLDLYNGSHLAGVSMGEIHLTVRYAPVRRSLVVLINGCRKLMPCSQHGAHPYVRIYLLPDKRWAMRKKTAVKRRTLSPQYDEKFEFFETLEDVKKRVLDVAVKNRRPFLSHERKELGRVLIDLSKEDLVNGFSQWYELTINGLPRR